MSGDGRLVRVLVACYPSAWRRRFGDEYAQLLRDLRVHRHPALVVDSLRGAVRAHGGVLVSRPAPLTVVVRAAALFTVAGAGFAKLAEDVREGRPLYALLVAAAGVALLALVVAALPTGVALVRGGDRRARAYVAVPVVGVAGWFLVLAVARTAASGRDVHSAANVVAFLLVAGAGIAVVAATAWAADRVLRRVPAAQPRLLRPVSLLATAAGMTVATAAALVWGLQVRAADPSTFRGDQGILATPFVASWIAVVGALAVAAGFAATAARRQLTAR